ncbi:hypothetical protein GWK47_018127 [Chionoecetes opilio]|uniref:Uncharacterized protein n=1 Tax=Chionoecetes opilio TaxID=41210 RepID=A0A8J4XVI1_CHIOP|nr:hypothetical protein GWK47_018127 [Chionoecetes opilio]
MGGWLRRSCWCPTFSAPSPGPSHGPGRELSGSLAATSTPPLPRPSTYLGVGAVRVAMQVGVLGVFRVASSPFPPHCFTLLFQRINCEAQGRSVSFRSRGHQFCSSHAPCLLSDLFRPADCPVCCGWLRLILPEGGVPCFTGEAYADLKEWWSKALKSRQRSHFRLSWADRSLGSRLGLAKSSISSSSRTSRPPASASMSSASIVLTVEQDLAVSSVPHHDRDSQVEDLPAGSVAPTAGQASPGPSPPSPPVPPGLSAWMSSVNSFMARMEGHLTSGSQRRRRSPSPASLSPLSPSESVVVEDDYLVCSDGEEDAALPVPKRRRFGTSAPWLPVRRALPPPFLLRCLLGALPLVPLRRMPWDSLLLPPSCLPGHRCHRRLLVRRLTGVLLPSVVWRTLLGPVSGLGGASLPGGRGTGVLPLPPDSFLSPERSLEAACGFFGGRFGCSGLLTG